MPDAINDKVTDYATSFSEPTDGLLKEIEDFTLNHHAHSNMLSGPLQGKLLEMLSKIIRPQRILEVGTFTGYSALCLVKGLQPGGELHTMELRNEDAEIAQNYFTKSSHNEQIILHRGNALEIIPTLDEKWDLVFIDADKINYITYYELVLPGLKKGGVILADNVLFHGEVLNEKISGKNAIAIHAFNEHVAKDERVQQVIITLRDGLMMIIKK
ncbi:MAG: O-methyltransferase [Ginsengibacter sp.]